MLLSALAAVAAVAVVASPPQDPSFEYPAIKHIGFDLPKEGENGQSVFAPQGKQATDRVSVSFKNASLREVLDWLKDQGVSFVVKDDQVDKGARVSINAVNQPLGDVMSALARSLNGHWARNKDIWVFQNGVGFLEVPGAEGMRFDGNFPALQGEKLSKEQQQQLNKAMEKMGDSKVWEQHAKEMEKWNQDLAKRMEGQKFEYKMDPKAMEEFQKHMMELSKDGKTFHYELKPGQNGFTWDGKQFKQLDEKQILELQKNAMEAAKQGQRFWSDGDRSKMFDEKAMKELQEKWKKMGKEGTPFFVAPENGFFKMDEKAMKEWQDHIKKMGKDGIFYAPDSGLFKMDEKAMRNWQEKMKKLGKDGQGFYFSPEGGALKMDEKAMREMAEKMRKMGKDGVFAAPGFRFDQKSPFFKDGGSSFKSHNLKAIYDSLTPAQTQTLQSRGFLRYSDLNGNQKAMLGIIGEDNWTISYKTDKVNLTIKSDR
jgi:hypothetical protein